ncbi:MAG: carboxypeptidase regulatory-like domain-containing protein [Thermoguttaceae bacterium]|nr:carboxypeptidase regulatory-like domain-containing protein [Thermoguttaceae bacterium]
MKKLALALVAALCCSLVGAGLVGCSKARIKGLVPVEGVVTLNGEPVSGATVMFAPKKHDPSRPKGSAQAVTDASGKFKMSTLDPGDGVFPGDYYVTVTKDRVEGGLSLEEVKRQHENPELRDNASEPEQTLIRELPDKYADINSSGLDQTIPAEGNKNLELALEGEVDATPRPMNSGRGAGPGMR